MFGESVILAIHITKGYSYIHVIFSKDACHNDRLEAEIRVTSGRDMETR